MSSPKIILYTNRYCPWAHRAHVALKELGLPYEEISVELSAPREPWYLEVNPRGLVPSLSYDGNIVTESAIISQFLADAHPSHLLPPSTTVLNALYRARVAFFVDSFVNKVVPHLFASMFAATPEEKDSVAETLANAVAKEIEPLLTEGKGPFFDGSDRLTLAEVETGSFLLRLLDFSKPKYSLLSPKLPGLLEELPKFTRWAEATVQHPSVNHIWDAAGTAEKTKRKIAELSLKK